MSRGDVIFEGIIIFVLGLIALLIVYPLIYVISASFSDAVAVTAGKMYLWPVDLTLENYAQVFKNKNIMTGYRNSLSILFLGTSLNLVMTVLAAYPLSQKDLWGRNVLMKFIIFTMFFSGGLIPTYLLIRDLKMLDTIWPMILPNSVWPWFIILARTFMVNSIPEELYESANLDGCSVYGMLWYITLPLSGAILAVVALYCAVGNWNSYFDAFIYLSKPEMHPLQVVLRNILILNSMDIGQVTDLRNMASRQGMTNLLKYAIIVVSSAPLLILYPFVQKYFVKGVMIGSVKG